MDFVNFQNIYPDLPHNVAIYYLKVKNRFNLSHEQAYKATLDYAINTSQAVGQVGKPACKSNLRLLLRREI